jgi:hypothetical protein
MHSAHGADFSVQKLRVPARRDTESAIAWKLEARIALPAAYPHRLAGGEIASVEPQRRAGCASACPFCLRPCPPCPSDFSPIGLEELLAASLREALRVHLESSAGQAIGKRHLSAAQLKDPARAKLPDTTTTMSALRALALDDHLATGLVAPPIVLPWKGDMG